MKPHITQIYHKTKVLAMQKSMHIRFRCHPRSERSRREAGISNLCHRLDRFPKENQKHFVQSRRVHEESTQDKGSCAPCKLYKKSLPRITQIFTDYFIILAVRWQTYTQKSKEVTT